MRPRLLLHQSFIVHNLEHTHKGKLFLVSVGDIFEQYPVAEHVFIITVAVRRLSANPVPLADILYAGVHCLTPVGWYRSGALPTTDRQSSSVVSVRKVSVSPVSGSNERWPLARKHDAPQHRTTWSVHEALLEILHRGSTQARLITDPCNLHATCPKASFL